MSRRCPIFRGCTVYEGTGRKKLHKKMHLDGMFFFTENQMFPLTPTIVVSGTWRKTGGVTVSQFLYHSVPRNGRFLLSDKQSGDQPVKDNILPANSHTLYIYIIYTRDVFSCF